MASISRVFDKWCNQNVQFGRRLWLFGFGYFEFDQILDTLPNADELSLFLAEEVCFSKKSLKI